MSVRRCSSDGRGRDAWGVARTTWVIAGLLVAAPPAVAPAQPPAAVRSDGSASAAQDAGARPALSGAARWADTVRATIDRAVYAGDRSAVASAVALAERALRAFPDDALLLHYLGTALWREGQLLLGRDDAAALALFERALPVLQRSAAVRPMAETQAILGSVLGSLAGQGMLAGMRYGPKASEAEAAARKLGPDNPRVHLLAAVSAWYKPAAFGGGRDKARAALARALAAFEHDAPPPPLPAWGHAEAYVHLGRFEAAEGRIEAAREAYRRALALAPDYQWVSRVLLPALDQRH
jgi:tetratricopeptide (TPR) repeat protein